MIININTAPCSITDLYQSAARELGYTEVDELYFDCRKINITKEMQDCLYDFYTQKANEQDVIPSENDIKMNITMMLAISGPKVNAALKANEVEVLDGFICS